MNKIKKILLIAGASVFGLMAFQSYTYAADGDVMQASFTDDGQVMIPKNWREWVFCRHTAYTKRT